MSISAGYLIYFIRNFTNINWSRFISKWTMSQLSILSSTASKQSANLINKCWILRSTFNLVNIWFKIIIKIYKSRTEDDSHITWSIIATSTLAIIIISPRISISIFAKNQSMNISAFCLNRHFIKKSLN